MFITAPRRAQVVAGHVQHHCSLPGPLGPRRIPALDLVHQTQHRVLGGVLGRAGRCGPKNPSAKPHDAWIRRLLPRPKHVLPLPEGDGQPREGVFAVDIGWVHGSSL